MGIRMSIRIANDPDGRTYGDDHKMYGYFDYYEVMNSFDFLADVILGEHDGSESEELYRDSFYVDGFTVTLKPRDFKVFADLYLEDLQRTRHTKECIEAAKSYLDICAKSEDDKVLVWG